ncbi:hypothetical protein TNCV_835871 [Trichonephila clavipes]|nr:hypothetical protein TNCV_835871 [Trichonephila clavipes]
MDANAVVCYARQLNQASELRGRLLKCQSGVSSFLFDINDIIIIEWVPRGQTVKQLYYIEVLRKSEEEKARSVEQQLVDFAPKKRLGSHCALCKTVLGGQMHYCARVSTVPTRSRIIQLIPDSKSEKCIYGNTFSSCRRGEGKNGPYLL